MTQNKKDGHVDEIKKTLGSKKRWNLAYYHFIIFSYPFATILNVPTVFVQNKSLPKATRVLKGM